MMDLLFRYGTDPQFLVMMLTFLAVTGTVVTFVLPVFERDKLKSRMKSAATEREKIRNRERAALAKKEQSGRGSLRNQDQSFMRDLVDKFNLKKVLADESTAGNLRMAGFRGQGPLAVYLFARFVLPAILFLVALFYLFVLLKLDHPPMMKVSAAIVVAIIGFYLPNLYISNLIKKRQLSIQRAWPDSLDLMLICVESGMSVEVAFRKVSEEIAVQSIPLAEELTLATAELSYLQERRQAYENLATRTGLDSVRAVSTAMIQAERYGTPVSTALRVLADENREMRMTLAEKKAAALPPKLTVPMIIFFLPVLFAVIMGPAILKVMKL